jgi:hypothetical protein
MPADADPYVVSYIGQILAKSGRLSWKYDRFCTEQ